MIGNHWQGRLNSVWQWRVLEVLVVKRRNIVRVLLLSPSVYSKFMIKSWIHLLTIQQAQSRSIQKPSPLSSLSSLESWYSRLSLEVLAHGFTFECVKTPFQQLSLDCQAKGNHDMSSMLCMLGVCLSWNVRLIQPVLYVKFKCLWMISAFSYCPCHLFNSYTVYICFSHSLGLRTIPQLLQFHL